MYVGDTPAEQPPSPSNTGPTLVVSTLTTGLAIMCGGNCVAPALGGGWRISDTNTNNVKTENFCIPSLAISVWDITMDEQPTDTSSSASDQRWVPLNIERYSNEGHKRPDCQ